MRIPINQLNGFFSDYNDFLNYLQIKKSEQVVNFDMDSFNEEIVQSILSEKIDPQDVHFVRHKLEEMGISKDAIDIFLQFNTKDVDEIVDRADIAVQARQNIVSVFQEGGLLHSKLRRAVAVTVTAIGLLGGYSLLSSSKNDKEAEKNPGITGTAYMEQCKEIEGACDDVVLDAVSKYNMPSSWNDWVEIEAESKDGDHTVKFFVSPHALRIGTDKDWVEIPVTGNAAEAITEITHTTLVRLSVIELLHKKAKEEDHHMKFYDRLDDYRIGHEKYPKTYPLSQGKLLALSNTARNNELSRIQRNHKTYEIVNELRHEWLSDNHIKNSDLISGYFKNIIDPTQKAKNKLYLYGGFFYNSYKGRKNGLFHTGLGTVHPENYEDYSHGVRLMLRYVLIDGDKKEVDDFFKSDASNGFSFSTKERSMLKKGHHYRIPEEMENYIVEHKWEEDPNDEKFK